ncbi:hypothetical protein ES703_87760 [subsurface metagenome]
MPYSKIVINYVVNLLGIPARWAARPEDPEDSFPI